jgi:hypothetical protein
LGSGGRQVGRIGGPDIYIYIYSKIYIVYIVYIYICIPRSIHPEVVLYRLTEIEKNLMYIYTYICSNFVPRYVNPEAYYIPK